MHVLHTKPDDTLLYRLQLRYESIKDRSCLWHNLLCSWNGMLILFCRNHEEQRMVDTGQINWEKDFNSLVEKISALHCPELLYLEPTSQKWQEQLNAAKP